jgi:hypothetical protein
MKPLRLTGVATIAAAVSLSACGSPDEAAYRSAVVCLANELELHRFVDQQTDPAHMLPADGRRIMILRAKAMAVGDLLGLPHARIEQEAREQAASMERQDSEAMRRNIRNGLNSAVLERVLRARTCLPTPAGSTRPS